MNINWVFISIVIVIILTVNVALSIVSLLSQTYNITYNRSILAVSSIGLIMMVVLMIIMMVYFTKNPKLAKAKFSSPVSYKNSMIENMFAQFF
jgi:hypothetical protein